MYSTLLSLLISIFVCVGVLAQSKEGHGRSVQATQAVKSSLSQPSAEIQKLIAMHKAAKGAYADKFKEFKPRFEAFALKHRDTDAGLEAEFWLFTGCMWSRADGTMNEKAGVVAERIIKHHISSKKLGKIMDLSYVFSIKQKKEFGERLLRLSSHPEVHAAMHLTLGTMYRLSPDPKMSGPAVARLKLLCTKYKDVPYRSTTYGRMADAILNPHPKEDLAVGKIAPEILGVSIDGKPMQLSDYRGKIVVLDFWGEW